MRVKRGAVLILSLWVLSFLAVLAISVAAGIRQKIVLLKHLDERNRVNYITQAAIKKAVAMIHQQMDLAGYELNPSLKAILFNNNHAISRVDLKDDWAQVTISDENGKININTTNTLVLKNLIMRVLSVRPEEALGLANSILDWRQYGEGEAKGFFSDEYYANLQYPYRKKDAGYQSLDELLLVKGITKDVYTRLLPFITIYGDGKVNVNTAPGAVLVALGLDDDIVEKVLVVRAGKDGVDGTMDDHLFVRTFDVAVEVNAAFKMQPQQLHAIDIINQQGVWSVSSAYVTIHSTAHVATRPSLKEASAVLDVRGPQLVYWKEK